MTRQPADVRTERILAPGAEKAARGQQAAPAGFRGGRPGEFHRSHRTGTEWRTNPRSVLACDVSIIDGSRRRSRARRSQYELQFWPEHSWVLPRPWVSAAPTFHSRITSLEERANEIEEGPQEV